MTVWLFIFLQYSQYIFYISRKFQFASMNVSSYHLAGARKLKISLQPYHFEKLNVFPSKNHLTFLTTDIELTNIKISDKNIVPGKVVPGPLKGGHFCYLEFLLILTWNAESAKNFEVQNFIIRGNRRHHSLIRKIAFRVISSFIIDWKPASKFLILSYSTRPIFFLHAIMDFRKNSKSSEI